MYNKLFNKILDSSIWLAPDPHRIVWITLIAAMDEDGNAMFACVKNLAARARVSDEACAAAVKAFESPDEDSGDPEFDGRRIEPFPGGWHILNAHKYRGLVTKAIARENTRIRTARWRAKKKTTDDSGNSGDASVTHSDALVTKRDHSVTPSVSVSISTSDKKHMLKPDGLSFDIFWQAYPKKVNRKKAEAKWKKLSKENRAKAYVDCQTRFKDTDYEFIPHPTTYLNGERWNDEAPRAPTEKKGVIEQLHDAIQERRRNDNDAQASFGTENHGNDGAPPRLRAKNA